MGDKGVRGAFGNISINTEFSCEEEKMEYVKAKVTSLCQALAREMLFEDAEAECNLKCNILCVGRDLIQLSRLLKEVKLEDIYPKYTKEKRIQLDENDIPETRAVLIKNFGERR